MNDTEEYAIMSADIIYRCKTKGQVLVAKEQKNGFKTIETNSKELEEKLREYREQKKAKFKLFLRVLLVIGLLILVVDMIYALRSYSAYEATDSVERDRSSATQFEMFGECLLEYSNDGISCMDVNHEIIWNQSFEMISPEIVICKEYLAIYDASGTQIYIMTKGGLQKRIETALPIQTVCIAEQGTIAVLMKENNVSQIKLFDTKGNELANGKFYGDKGGFPIDIALSYDGTKLAVDMVNVAEGNVSTAISFYNFGSVGQSEIDNNVGSYLIEGVLVPQIEYVSNSRMIGIGTGRILVFEGSQKPELAREIVLEEEILSCFHNEKYVGIVYNNIDEEELWHIKVMDFRGNTIMENDTSIPYTHIEFLSNNEICVTSATECQLFTTHSIKKFSYTFDKELYKILAGTTGQNYTFIFKDTIEEVKLK